MPKTLNALADRMLTAFVPKASASACCPPDPWTEVKCPQGRRWNRTCNINCQCNVVCGAWVNSGFLC